MATKTSEFTIEPTRGWRFLDLREFWSYRDLLALLVWRDVVSRYKQTVLGPLWFIIQPLLTTIVFTVVFGRVAQIPTDGIPPMLFYLCGLLPWNYFAQSFQSTSTALVNNAGLFGKVYFPRVIMPLSGVLSNLVAFAIQALTFAVFFAIYSYGPYAQTFHFSWTALAIPLFMVQLAALSLGFGLAVAALTAKFRDFSILASFMVQLWLYATPVIYPLSRVPVRWRLLVALNPLTMPVEYFRHMLLDTPSPDPRLLAISGAVTLLTLGAGLLVFQRVERTFVDVL